MEKKHDIFCQYVTSSLGAKCLMWAGSSYRKFCKRHEGKAQKKFVPKADRFRGNSDFQRDILGYKSNKE